MSFLDEFQSNLEALPTILQKKYGLVRDLDKSLQGIQRQNEQRCQQEIEEIKKRSKAGGLPPDSPLLKLSEEAVDEQKHAVRIADEKVALALQAYDLVDTHIQQLDQYMRKRDEEIRRENEAAAAAASVAASPSSDSNTKSGKTGESSVGRGRKKTRLATATASASASTSAPATTSANPTGMDLDLPVDPNEPTYCICNQVSFGEMVACDNPSCKIEWFHYSCVGLKDPPKGNWYCPDCHGTRGRRKTKS